MTTYANAAAQQPNQMVPLAAFQALQRENASLKRENEQLRNDVKYLKPFKAMYDAKRKLDAIPNTVAAPVTKAVYEQCQRVFDTREPRADGLYPIKLEYMATPIGSTEPTVSNSLDKLEANRIIKSKVEKDSQGHQHILIAPVNFTIDALAKSEPTGHGGKRVALHKNCGGVCTQDVTYTCPKCGETGIRKPHILMVDEEKWEGWQKEAIEDHAPPEEEENEPVAQAVTPELQAPARDQIEPSVSVTKGEQSHESEPSSHIHYNERSAIVVKGEPQVPSNAATNVIPFVPTAVPHCKHMNCLLGSNRTQPRFNGVYYCPIHRGFIDEKGQPL